MKKKTVRMMLSAIAAMAMVCTPGTVLAGGIDEAGQIIDGSELTLSDFVEDEKLVLTRGNHLAKGTVSLTDLGNCEVGLGGSTTCHVDCDTIICNIYLEQKDDEGYWNNYDYWNFSTTDDHGLLASTTCDVDGGHWYRAKGAHIAILNNAIESTVTVTNGIWIDQT